MASNFPAYVAWGAEHTVVEEYTPGTAFLVGDFVYYDTSGNTMTLCGANPALIAGISEVSSAAAILLTPTAKAPVRLITSFNCVIAFSSATTPADTHLGDTYGITRTASAPYQWQLDIAKTGADARALVVKVDIGSGTFFCHMLNTELQFAAVA